MIVYSIDKINYDMNLNILVALQIFILEIIRILCYINKDHDLLVFIFQYRLYFLLLLF